MPQIATETWYVWRVYECVEDEVEPRLLIPRSDPFKWEDEFNFIYESTALAVTGRDTELEVHEGDIDEVAYIKTWVLCKQTTEPVVEGT